MAVPTSFKQQCPSCEAMVPIRDPKLVGRKIDCPKCKYRFIVEEPAEEGEEAEDEAPAKKGKGGTAITNKKSANGKAAKAPVKRRADDDQDQDEGKPKKKQGGSGMLVVGISLGAVAILALAFGAYFIFSSGDSDEKPTASRSSSNANTPSNSGEQEKPKEAPKPAGPRPRQEDITNLLPKDTQVVLNVPMEHLLGNNQVNQALLNTPGSFHVGAFQSIWGIAPTDVRRVVLASSVEKKFLFSVMRTKVQLKEKQIVETLKLQPEEPINGLKYYLVKKPLDALSTFLLKGALLKGALLKGAVAHDRLALRFMDPFTVVCADVGAMNQFLQDKEQPEQHAKKDTAEQPKDGGEQAGTPDGPQGGPPGGRRGGGARGGMRGGPPGGPPGGAPGRGAGGPRGGGSGGFRPPSGMPGGTAPAGMTGEGGGANEAASVSSSYMSIDPNLKAVLDQIEKVDKTENQNVLLSYAYSTSLVSVEEVKKLIAPVQSLVGGSKLEVPEAALKVFLDQYKGYVKAEGVAVIEFNDSRVAGNAAAATKDAATAQQWENVANENAPKLLAMFGLDLVSRNAGRNNNRPNMGGMQGGPPGGMRGGGMMPGGGMRGGPPGGMQGGPPMGRRGGGRGGMRPGGPGMQPGGPNMQQQTGADNTQETTGKLGDYAFWTKDNVLALGVNINLESNLHKVVGAALEALGILGRSMTALTDRQSHIHELAAAMQAYLNEKGHFPRGTVQRGLDSQRVLDWRPDQRLSWMTEILPYLANGEFKDIKPDYGKDNKTWYEDPTNLKAGMAVIPQFVAPLPPDDINNFYVQYPNLPVKDTNLLWAVTHFVGMAGVGLDAAEYRADDPAKAKLRGVFGYDRETKKAEITDGLNQTIVLIQVPPEPRSPWIAGGGSTVRGVSEDLDCVKPFVCTEYQGKRGTFAIMADGKVRFIPETIDPKTFQAMCTIAGGDRIGNLEKVAPEVPPPEDQPQAELKTEQPARPDAKKPAQTPPAAPKTPTPEKTVQPPTPSAPKQPAAPPSK